MFANHKIKISRRKITSSLVKTDVYIIRTEVNYKTFISQSLKVTINGPTVLKQANYI